MPNNYFEILNYSSKQMHTYLEINIIFNIRLSNIFKLINTQHLLFMEWKVDTKLQKAIDYKYFH